jgi:ribosomal protein S18 acetylase RimI-like enzyme
MTSRDDPAIREGTADDIEAVLAFWREASDHVSVSDDPDGMRLLLAHQASPLLIAEVGGEMAGTLIAAWDGWRGHFYRLAVRPALRRRGIGLALIREGERRLRALGARRIGALVEGEDERATAFWRAAGYTLDEKMARYLKMLQR